MNCNHKDFDSSCPQCVEGRSTRAEEAERIEAEVLKAYEVGGFRGVTRYVMGFSE